MWSPIAAVALLRALPRLQHLHPEARVVIVGEQEGVSYGKPAPGEVENGVFEGI